MLLPLLLLPTHYLATEILQRFTVRIHSRIVEKGKAWARLWYLFRALDREGSGYIRLPMTEICQLLTTSSSTTYQWLREGKTAGAFRWWKCQRGILRVTMGGLFAVCRQMDLEPDLTEKPKTGPKPGRCTERPRRGIAPWGVVSEISVFHLAKLSLFRAAATASVTQRLQELSRYAAWANLPKAARKVIKKLPQPSIFFDVAKRPSLNNARGAINFCLHVGKRIWVSKGFIPFGTSQQGIAQERGVCRRTVQRHLNLMEIDRRQIVQSKGEYRDFATAINLDIQGPVARHESCILSCSGEEYYLTEQPGGIGKPYESKVGEVGFTRIQTRFFSYGKKPKIWIYRTNLYRPSMKLCTMSAARNRYRVTQKRCAGGTTLCNSLLNQLENFKHPTPSQADKEGHFS